MVVTLIQVSYTITRVFSGVLGTRFGSSGPYNQEKIGSLQLHTEYLTFSLKITLSLPTLFFLTTLVEQQV